MRIWDSLTKEAMLRIVKDKLDEYGQVNAKFSQDVLPGLKVIPSLEELLDQIAIQLPWDYTVRQGVLESNSLEARYEVSCGRCVRDGDLPHQEGFPGKGKSGH